MVQTITELVRGFDRIAVEGGNPNLQSEPARLERQEERRVEQESGSVGVRFNVPNEEKPDRNKITAGLNGCVLEDLIEESRENYQKWYGDSLHQVARGSIQDDKYRRFQNGSSIRTSLLVRDDTHEDGSRYLYTLNSIYEVLS